MNSYKRILATKPWSKIITDFKSRVTTNGGTIDSIVCNNQFLYGIKRFINKASLIITPAGYKEGRLYSVKPNDGNGDLTWIRATDATRINKDGYIERVCWNLLSYSEEFDNAYWGKTATLSVTQNTTIAPNNTLTADTFTTSSTDNFPHVVRLGVLVTTIGVSYNGSVFIKKGTNNFVTLRLISGAVDAWVIVDLSSKTISSTVGSPHNVIIDLLDNDWVRLSFSITATDTSGLSFRIYPVALGSGSIGTQIIWGAQLVEGSEPKDYFPTTDRLNVPRINYPIGGGCPSILIEPQRTNLFLQSNNLATTPWNYSEVNVTENFDTFRNFGVNKIVSLGGLGRLVQAVTTTIGQTYTISFWCKNIDATAVRIFVSTSSTFSYNYTSLINTSNYSFISYSFIAGSTSTIIQVVRDLPSGESVLIQGVQLEVGATSTSYIPTTTTSVTRNADIVEKTNISDLIGQTEGTVFLTVDVNSTTTGLGSQSLVVLRPSSGSFMTSYILSSGSLGIDFYPQGSYLFSLNGGSIGLGENKIAIVYKSGNYKLFKNGTLVASNNNNTTPNLTLSVLSLPNTFNGSRKNIALFKQALTDAECIALTTL